MPRSTRISKVAWAAGPVDSPLSLASFPVFGLTGGPEEEVEYIDNANLIGGIAPGIGRHGIRSSTVGFSVELTPQTATSLAPFWGALMRALGCAETTAGSSYVGYIYTQSATAHKAYSSDNGGADALDIYVSRGATGASDLALRYIALNCLGTGSIIFEAGKPAILQANFIGQISSAATLTASGATDTALTGMGTFAAQPGRTQVGGATIAGVSGLVVRKVTMDLGNQLAARPDISGDFGGMAAPAIMGANPVMEIEVEHEPLATVDWSDYAINRSNVAVSFTHAEGAGNGNEMAITYTGNVVGNPELYEENGILMTRLRLAATYAAGAYTGPFTITIQSAA